MTAFIDIFRSGQDIIYIELLYIKKFRDCGKLDMLSDLTRMNNTLVGGNPGNIPQPCRKICIKD